MKGSTAGSASAELWRRYRETGDPEARAELLSQYQGLVHHTVRQIAARVGDAVEFDDLLGAGALGLVRAFEAFDSSRGTAFTTYATQRIRGAVLDELRAADWRPRSAREQGRQVQQAETALAQDLGRSPSPTEVAARLQVDLDTYWGWKEQSRGATMMPLESNAPGHEPGGVTLAERIADRSQIGADARLEDEQLRVLLRDAIGTLPEQQRVVLALCYDEELNLRQIAEVLHVTESRVSQVRTAAIRNLRTRLAEEIAA
ncbi:MAG TPA: RNA polymerase sigma factor FliA [Gemmatimonadales bacterium]